MTRFWGGEQRGKCLQVTGQKLGYITMDHGEALQLAEALLQFVNDTRPEEEPEAD